MFCFTNFLNMKRLHELEKKLPVNSYATCMLHTITGCAVAPPGVNGDRLSKGRMAKFDPAQIRNPSTDWHKIWNRWLRRRDDPQCKISCKSVHWGLLGKCVKYNENFSMVYIPLFFVDRPTGQTARRIFTHDGSNDAVSRKGVPF